MFLFSAVHSFRGTRFYKTICIYQQILLKSMWIVCRKVKSIECPYKKILYSHILNACVLVIKNLKNHKCVSFQNKKVTFLKKCHFHIHHTTLKRNINQSKNKWMNCFLILYIQPLAVMWIFRLKRSNGFFGSYRNNSIKIFVVFLFHLTMVIWYFLTIYKYVCIDISCVIILNNTDWD